jgi:AcrR family transcriptional regulator
MRRYHHGDLRRALLGAAVDAIAERGPAGLSLRDVARRVGVSHAASTHHFVDKTGLLTAIAAEGYRLLAAELGAAWERTGSFLEVGVAYVRFALAHPAHFQVMFRPELHRPGDPGLTAAQRAAAELLYGPVASVGGGDGERDRRLAGVAAWSLVHGLATLWLGGSLPPELRDDPEELTRAVAAHLFRPADSLA